MPERTSLALSSAAAHGVLVQQTEDNSRLKVKERIQVAAQGFVAGSYRRKMKRALLRSGAPVSNQQFPPGLSPVLAPIIPSWRGAADCCLHEARRARQWLRPRLFCSPFSFPRDKSIVLYCGFAMVQ